MLQNERKQYILELINRDRIVRAADLVERLGVSMETIRRDLEELEKAGNLRRVYGGAVLGTIYSPEPSYYNREVTHAAQKRAIAAAVYNLIEDEDTLFLDGGTTPDGGGALHCGREQAGHRHHQHAVQLSCEVVKNEFCGAILLGGAPDPGEPPDLRCHCQQRSDALSCKQDHSGCGGRVPCAMALQGPFLRDRLSEAGNDQSGGSGDLCGGFQ